MTKKILKAALFSLIFFLLINCAGTKKAPVAQLDQLFERNFEGFNSPSVSEIIQEGRSKIFPQATFDEVWDAITIVLMQQGIIVRSSKDTGIIVSIANIPTAIYLEKGNEVTLYLKYIDNLTDETIAEDTKGTTTDDLMKKIATQLYSEKKWPYLKK